MKTLLIPLVIIALSQNDHRLTNSTWTCKIKNGCIDTLRLKEGNKSTEYDCEMSYTISGSYKINNDTLIITEMDDSHSEDHTRVTCYRTKYLVKKDVLKRITVEKLSNSNWARIMMESDFDYQRIR